MIITFIIFFYTVLFILQQYVSSPKSYIYFTLFFLIVQFLFLNTRPSISKSETKYDLLNYIPDKYKPKTEIYNPQRNYDFPFILKPNNCSSLSKNVKIINNQDDLDNYTLQPDTIIQEYIDTKYEIVIGYERNPLSNNDKITAIIVRPFEKHNILVPTFHPNFLFTSQFKNRVDLITPKINKIMDEISKKIPDFHMGRYDIRLNDLNDIKEGKNFYILEVNGVMGFDLRKDCYPYLSIQSFYYKIRFILLRIYFGLINLLFLRKSINLSLMMKSYSNALACRSFEKLITTNS